MARLGTLAFHHRTWAQVCALWCTDSASEPLRAVCIPVIQRVSFFPLSECFGATRTNKEFHFLTSHRAQGRSFCSKRQIWRESGALFNQSFVRVWRTSSGGRLGDLYVSRVFSSCAVNAHVCIYVHMHMGMHICMHGFPREWTHECTYVNVEAWG